MDNEFQNNINDNQALTPIEDNLIRDERGRFLPSEKPSKKEIARVDKKMMTAMIAAYDFIVSYWDVDFQTDFAMLSPKDRLDVFCKLINKFFPNNANVNLNDESRASSEKEIVDRLVAIAGGFNGINE